MHTSDCWLERMFDDYHIRLKGWPSRATARQVDWLLIRKASVGALPRALSCAAICATAHVLPCISCSHDCDSMRTALWVAELCWMYSSPIRHSFQQMHTGAVLLGDPELQGDAVLVSSLFPAICSEANCSQSLSLHMICLLMTFDLCNGRVSHWLRGQASQTGGAERCWT